jgi:antitoxin component of MazEF toxin-antitoxin module
MIMTTIQKIIKIGSSKGVTLPAKDLKRLGVDVGDEVELVVRKQSSTDSGAVAVATALIERYEDDFKNLANR